MSYGVEGERIERVLGRTELIDLVVRPRVLDDRGAAMGVCINDWTAMGRIGNHPREANSRRSISVAWRHWKLKMEEVHLDCGS